jgi:predicted ester cyclase
MLPRHWDWLEEQPNGISGALRRILEHAIRANPGKERSRRERASLSRVLAAVAGDRPNYEEACRALFRGDLARFEELVLRWPKDIRDYAAERARKADRAAEESPDPAQNQAALSDLYRLVWTQGDYRSIERLIAPRYTIHSDPGDLWEGQTLDRTAYEERVRYSRTAFPDLRFTPHEMVAFGDRVAVRWSAQGTQEGDLRDLPATLKCLAFAGQTFYEMQGGKVLGHWQVVDRLGFLEELRRTPSPSRPSS